MNIENWFKEGTGFKIKELRYLKPPEIPYFLYQDRKIARGADLLNNIIEHNITVERYSETNKDSDLEDIQKVNDLLEKYNYTYDSQTEWLDSEGMYGTFWVLDPILEKVRKEGN